MQDDCVSHNVSSVELRVQCTLDTKDDLHVIVDGGSQAIRLLPRLRGSVAVLKSRTFGTADLYPPVTLATPIVGRREAIVHCPMDQGYYVAGAWQPLPAGPTEWILDTGGSVSCVCCLREPNSIWACLTKDDEEMSHDSTGVEN